MATIVSETATVTSASPGLLVIKHSQIWSDGTDFGGEFVLDAASAVVLAERIEDAGGEAEVAVPPDKFWVKLGGSEWDPIINVQNERDAAAPRGGFCSLGVREATALEIAAQLRAFGAGAKNPR